MTIVLTNDDGIDAPGIRAMQAALRRVSDEPIAIVAPKDHLSGCSHQATTHRPIAVEERSPQAFAVDGTPVDCVRLALRYLCPDVHLVLSGINAGGNMGADIYISGTVAAAREAALMRVPGIAISHYIQRGRSIDWEVAADRAAKALEKLRAQPLEIGAFWNVNLPHPLDHAPEPDLVICACCTQPLPTDFQRQENVFRYSGEYGQRLRDPGADVDVCFGGQIAATPIRLFG